MSLVNSSVRVFFPFLFKNAILLSSGFTVASLKIRTPSFPNNLPPCSLVFSLCLWFSVVLLGVGVGFSELFEFVALFPSLVLENILPGVKQFEYYFPVVFSPPWIPITHMLELVAVYEMSNTLSSKFHHFLSVLILSVFCGPVLQLQCYSFTLVYTHGHPCYPSLVCLLGPRTVRL